MIQLSACSVGEGQGAGKIVDAFKVGVRQDARHDIAAVRRDDSGVFVAGCRQDIERDLNVGRVKLAFNHMDADGRAHIKIAALAGPLPVSQGAIFIAALQRAHEVIVGALLSVGAWAKGILRFTCPRQAERQKQSGNGHR